VVIKQKPFVRYNLEKKDDSFAVKLNPEERKKLEEAKQVIQQLKDSTALKQHAWIGAKVIQQPTLNLFFFNPNNCIITV